MAKRASKPKTQKISAKTNSQASMVPKSTLNNLDKLSRRILPLLQEDGRRSFSSIARELEVSEGAVRSRVNYLEEHEHLRFLAVIDPDGLRMRVIDVGGRGCEKTGKRHAQGRGESP